MSPPFVSLVAGSSLWKEMPYWAQLLHNETSDLKASVAKLLTMKEEIKSEIKVEDSAEFKDELSGNVAEIENQLSLYLTNMMRPILLPAKPWKLQRRYRKKTLSFEHKLKN